MGSADSFIRYREYRAYMARTYQGRSVLSYRDWLDYGHRA